MSQSVFGTINLHLRNFKSTPAAITITETEVIADPTTPSAKNSVLEAAPGFKYDRTSGSGFCNATELGNLITAYKAKTSYTLTVYLRGNSIYNGTCYIESLNYSAEPGSSLINLDIAWVGTDS